ncbi:MAG: FIST N-terminal domain-containing protein [Bdellovibrionota bacterium]
MNSKTSGIKKSVTYQLDPEKACLELERDLDASNAQFTLLFASNSIPVEEFAHATGRVMGPRVVGCTTAGEISPRGVDQRCVSGISFHGPDFEIIPVEIPQLHDLSQDSLTELRDVVDHVRRHEKEMGEGAKSFAVLLVDGLSNREELLAGTIGNYLQNIPLIGGSSGDGLEFKETHLFSSGHAFSDGALLLFVTTRMPFEIFKTQHFIESDRKVVITGSKPAERIVYEIDGEPAAECYARHLGIAVKDFSPMVFSEHPVMLKLNKEYYVRSIQKVNDDNSLTFYCAIDDGLVLTLAKKNPLFGTTEAALSSVAARFDTVEASLFFECILRRLEIEAMPASEQEQVNKLYSSMGAIGFHTYGEQFGSLHVNQTLTGVLFGRRRS